MEAPLKEEHVIMLPLMAQGHLIPFLALAKQIQQTKGFTVTIVNTPHNIDYLRRTVAKHPQPPPSAAQINLVALPFNSSDHGLPPNAENTEGLHLDKVITLFRASTALEAPLRRLISDMVATNHGRPPLCIISDVFMGWANEVAKSFNTVNVSFTTGGAYGTSAYMSLWQNLPHRIATGDEDEFPLPGFPSDRRLNLTQLHQFLRAADGTDEWSKFFQPQLAYSLNSFGWLCNTVEEIEPLGLEILRKYTKLPVWCVGPLLPSTMLSEKTNHSGIIGQRTGREPGVSPEKCLQWLNSHRKNSVLYISFGSQNTITPSQMMELAKGLEDSEKPFIWVLRPPVGFDLKGEFRPEWLPPGFEERVGGSKQGLLVHGWAPQLEILCHESAGAFLSHCGWNSVLESFSQGVPIIGWPLAAEQAYNAKMMMEEMGVCVELTRGLQSRIGSVEVKSVIELVMDENVDGKGEDMRRKAGEIGEKIRAAMREDEDGVTVNKGSSLQAMDDFVSALLSSRNE